MGFLILSILLYSLQSISNKAFSRRFPSRLTGILLLDALAMSLIVLIMTLLGGARMLPPKVMLLALLFSVVYILTIVTLQSALAAGPLGATILLNNIYMIFPVMASILFFGEVATVPRIIGIVCMVGVTVLSAPRDQKGGAGGPPTSLRWFILTCATTLGNGALTIIKRSLSWYSPETPAAAFSFWGFLFVAIQCWIIVSILCLRRQSFADWTADPKHLALCALGVGVATSGGTFFQLLALQTVAGIIVFPLTAGGILMVLWAWSLIVYKDRIKPIGFVALALGLTGIVLLST